MIRKFLFLAVLLTCRSLLFAQATSSLPADSNKVEHKNDVYRFKPKKLIVPAVLLGYGTLSLIYEPLKELNSSTRYEINEHQPENFTLDNFTQYVPAAAVYGLNAFGIKGRHNFADRTIIYATSTLLAAAVVVPLKRSIHEVRPDNSNNQSFPSGHTTTAFASAQFMFREYQEENFWLSLSGYPFAIFTGVYRTLNDRHWVGDVVAGAGFGILSTEAAYWLFPHIKKLLTRQNINNLQLYPSYQSKIYGLNLIKTF